MITKESETIEEYVDFARELKKAFNHEDYVDSNNNWRARNHSQWFRKENGGNGNQRKYLDHNTDDSIGEIR